MSNYFACTGEDVLADMRQRTLMVGLGSMKSGTSWLSAYLSAHPEFLHSPIKEMNYFNRQYPNPFRKMGSDFRLQRMEDIILRNENTIFTMGGKKLRALAQLGKINSHEDFLYYFAERVRNESHFGEISPANSHIPADGLRDMLTITHNVKIIFLMRDPTERAASHIQHLRRSGKLDKSIPEIVASINRSSPVYRRSDYRTTLRAMKKADLGDAGMTIIYEDMFQEETMRQFCHWLGISYVRPKFEKRYNEASGARVSEEEKLLIRDQLEPIYAGLAKHFGENRPARWRW